MTTTYKAPFTSPFHARSTAIEVAEGIDFTGKTVLITGGTLGIGFETAKVFAAIGAHVIITGRNSTTGQERVDKIIQETGNTNVEILSLDLSSLKSVRDFATVINERELKIDVLVNNAGIFFVPFEITEDGFEKHFAVNHIGHFLLTGLLIPALRRAADSGNQVRVVNITSGAHRFAKDISFSDLRYENKEFDKMQAYAESKLANVYHTVALNSRLQNAGIGSAFAVHPGAVYTEGASLLEDVLASLGFCDENGKFDRSKVLEPEEGAATTIFAATSPLLNGLGGLYLQDSNCYGTNAEGRLGLIPGADDPDTAENFWKKSEEWINQEILI